MMGMTGCEAKTLIGGQMSVCQAQNRSGTPDEFPTNSVTLCEVSQTSTCKLIRQKTDSSPGGSRLHPRTGAHPQP